MVALEELTFARRGGLLIAQITGEVDLSNVEKLRRQILDEVPNSATTVVLDFSETEYLDSSGIRLIFELSERLKRRGQQLELVIPTDSNVRRVLVLTEVQRIAAMHPSIDSLLQS
jgi:anti-anti-sigma factor